jgi:hypothetical protein
MVSLQELLYSIHLQFEKLNHHEQDKHTCVF